MVPFSQPLGALQELQADYTKGFFWHCYMQCSGVLMMYSEMAER